MYFSVDISINRYAHIITQKFADALSFLFALPASYSAERY